MAEYQKYEDLGYHPSYDSDAEEWSTPTGVLVLWSHWSGDYSWEEVALLHKQIGDQHLFFAYTDSGCSCKGAYEDYPRDDWGWTPRIEEARAQLDTAINGGYYDSDVEKLETRVSLRQFIRTLSL